jgi:hypothetical protein
LDKVFSLFMMRFIDVLHKATSVWVDTISQKVIPIMDTSVYPQANTITISTTNVSNWRKSIQDDQIIMGSQHAKICMPYPQWLSINNLKSNRLITGLVRILSYPKVGTPFPSSMQTIQASKHTKPPSTLVNAHLAQDVEMGRLSYIFNNKLQRLYM